MTFIRQRESDRAPWRRGGMLLTTVVSDRLNVLSHTEKNNRPLSPVHTAYGAVRRRDYVSSCGISLMRCVSSCGIWGVFPTLSRLLLLLRQVSYPQTTWVDHALIRTCPGVRGFTVTTAHWSHSRRRIRTKWSAASSNRWQTTLFAPSVSPTKITSTVMRHIA